MKSASNEPRILNSTTQSMTGDRQEQMENNTSDINVNEESIALIPRLSTDNYEF